MKAVLIYGKKHTILHWAFVAFRGLVLGTLRLMIMVCFLISGLVFFTTLTSPLNMILGFPTLGSAITLGLYFLYEMLAGIYSWHYSKTHCPFCDHPRIEFKNGFLRPFFKFF